MNKVILSGRLGADPEIRFTGTGTPVMNVNMCTTETWHKKSKNDGEGGFEKHDEWHRLVKYGQSADYYGKKLKKGDYVELEGALRTRKWTDKDGIDRWTTEILVRSIRCIISQARKNSDVPQEHMDEQPPLPEPTMGDDVPF